MKQYKSFVDIFFSLAVAQSTGQRLVLNPEGLFVRSGQVQHLGTDLETWCVQAIGEDFISYKSSANSSIFPDIVMYKGDIIEVKKADSEGAIQYNSTLPKGYAELPNSIYREVKKVEGIDAEKGRTCFYIHGITSSTVPTKLLIADGNFINTQDRLHLRDCIEELTDDIDNETILGSHNGLGTYGDGTFRVRPMYSFPNYLHNEYFKDYEGTALIVRPEFVNEEFEDYMFDTAEKLELEIEIRVIKKGGNEFYLVQTV